jgi:DNA repair exonuclease SbcCD ATPase subunit
MMRYLCLTMENFLVFKDVQTVRFPAADGVVVVYGDNGKGKTTLLNAFRFAFTGFARRRGMPASRARRTRKPTGMATTSPAR